MRAKPLAAKKTEISKLVSAIQCAFVYFRVANNGRQ